MKYTAIKSDKFIIGFAYECVMKNGVYICSYAPTKYFIEVKPLFDQFEKAVNDQVIPLAEQFGLEIDALELESIELDVRVVDVQIFEDSITFRINPNTRSNL